MATYFGIQSVTRTDGRFDNATFCPEIFSTPKAAFEFLVEHITSEDELESDPVFEFTFDHAESWGGQVGWEFYWAHPRDHGLVVEYKIVELESRA